MGDSVLPAEGGPPRCGVKCFAEQNPGPAGLCLAGLDGSEVPAGRQPNGVKPTLSKTAEASAELR